MKRYYYLFLTTLLGAFLANIVYFLSIFIVVVRKFIPREYVIPLTDMTLFSGWTYLIVALLGGYLGYRFGLKWWKIIYVDGVYYFNVKKTPEPQTSPGTRTRRTTRSRSKTGES